MLHLPTIVYNGILCSLVTKDRLPSRSCPLSPQLTGLKVFQNGVAGIDIIAPLSNGFMITSCFSFQNKMSIPSDPQSLVSNNLFK